jgi:hypothetical protein
VVASEGKAMLAIAASEVGWRRANVDAVKADEIVYLSALIEEEYQATLLQVLLLSTFFTPFAGLESAVQAVITQIFHELELRT